MARYTVKSDHSVSIFVRRYVYGKKFSVGRTLELNGLMGNAALIANTYAALEEELNKFVADYLESNPEVKVLLMPHVSSAQ